MNKHVQYLISETLGIELIFSSGSNMQLPLHTHVSSHVVLLVRRGCIRIDNANGKRSLQAGECFLLSQHCPHRLATSSPYAMLSFCLDATTFDADERRIPIALAAMVTEGHIFEQECDALLQALGGISSMKEPNDAVYALKERIVANPDAEMDLVDMAAFVHIDKYHLIRAFKNRYGLTPHTFLVQNRVRKARRELSNGVSMTHTALSAGFYDQSHFIRHFKRLHGLTPRQYLGSRKYISLCQRIQQRGGMNLANNNNPSFPASTE